MSFKQRPRVDFGRFQVGITRPAASRPCFNYNWASVLYDGDDVSVHVVFIVKFACPYCQFVNAGGGMCQYPYRPFSVVALPWVLFLFFASCRRRVPELVVGYEEDWANAFGSVISFVLFSPI